MRYLAEPVAAELVRKVNRFRADVLLDGRVVPVHIPNSGRLTELMTPGLPVLLMRAANAERKTPYTLKAVRYHRRWVCVDSTVPNRLAEEWLTKGADPLTVGYTTVRSEYSLGDHRYDFLLTGDGVDPMIVEIKSVTLVEKGEARFPDAPTARGASHVATMTRLLDEGYRGAVLFMIQRSDADRFAPNRATDPAFADTLVAARNAGIVVRALSCRVTERDIVVAGDVPVEL
jgi:sugar fermentation stimulation protein A